MSGAADRKDILRGAVASLGGFGGRMLARMILLVSAGHLYGAANIGVLGQLAAVIEILAAVATLGLKRTLLDKLNLAVRRGHDQGTVAATAILLSTGLGFVLAALLFALWPRLFDWSVPDVVFLAIPAAAFAEVALTATRFRRFIRWEVVVRCIMEPWSLLAAAMFFHAAGVRNDGLPLAYAVSMLVAAAASLWGLGRVFGFRRLMGWRPEMASLPDMFLASLPVGMSDIGVILLRRLDIILLSLFVDQRITGLYYMAQQVSTVPHRIYRLFEPMMGPVIAGLYHDRDTQSMDMRIVRVCRLVFILQLAVTLPLMVFGDAVMALFGDGFRAAAVILVILLVAELLDGSFALAETPLVFARPFVMPPLMMATLGVELVAILLLAPTWGATGTAVGFLFSTATLAAGRLFLLHRALRIRVVDWRYLPPLGIAIALGGLLVLVRGWLESPIAITVAVFGSAALMLALTALLGAEEDRRTFRKPRPRRRGSSPPPSGASGDCPHQSSRRPPHRRRWRSPGRPVAAYHRRYSSRHLRDR